MQNFFVLCYNKLCQHLIWGRLGFDGIVEAREAGSGFSLATLKNERKNKC